MTDFYALLKQSIIERGIRDSHDREAVYAQARQAIVKQLWAYQPPLAADEIDARVGAYDQAVERIEQDLQSAFADGGRALDERPARRLPPLPDPLPEPPPEVEPDDDEIAAPPLAEWRHDEAGHEVDRYALDDEDDYERGVPRAAANGRRSTAAYESRDDREEPARRAADDEPAYAYAYEARDDRYGGRATGQGHEPQHERWRNDSIEPRSGWLPALNERAMIQILAGAIAALIISLTGIGAYLYFGRDSGDAATVDIGVRRVVSDSATATRIAADTLEVVQSYSLFDGRDPTIFVTTPDNPVRFVSEEGFARAASSASAPGVKALIGPGLAARLAGNRVRVTIVARSSTDFGAAAMRFAYQSGLAISHWQTANLAPDYEAVGMIWRVPTMRTDPTGDYLVIEPGIPGDGTGVDIQSIKIDVLAGES
jgi:hypothetical protein